MFPLISQFYGAFVGSMAKFWCCSVTVWGLEVCPAGLTQQNNAPYPNRLFCLWKVKYNDMLMLLIFQIISDLTVKLIHTDSTRQSIKSRWQFPIGRFSFFFGWLTFHKAKRALISALCFFSSYIHAFLLERIHVYLIHIVHQCYFNFHIDTME